MEAVEAMDLKAMEALPMESTVQTRNDKEWLWNWMQARRICWFVAPCDKMSSSCLFRLAAFGHSLVVADVVVVCNFKCFQNLGFALQNWLGPLTVLVRLELGHGLEGRGGRGGAANGINSADKK